MQNKKQERRKLFYIVISILIAIGIWIYVDNVQLYPVSIQVDDIQIEYVGEDTTLADRGLMLLSDSDTTVSLTLEGTRKIIAQLDTSKIRVQADLSDVTTTGVQNLSMKIVYPERMFSKNLTLISSTPSSITADIGELYSKDVEIHCDIQGAVAKGYIAGEPQFQPETLEIRGPQESVDNVSYAKVTLKIDNATEAIAQTLDYQLYDQEDKLIDSTGIHAVADQIQVVLPVYIVKELPLTMNFIESAGSSLSNVDYTIEPATITVSGAASLLNDVDSIVLGDLSLSELSGTATYNYAITVPEGCENLSGVTRAKLKISFKDLSSSTLEATKFECENAPGGKTITILTNELSVAFRGPTADVAAVTPENLTVMADLKDVSSASGSYTVPATIRFDTDGDVGAVGEYQVKITISDGNGNDNNQPE